MYNTHFISINLSVLIVTVLAILLLGSLFSIKRVPMAMVLLAGLGLVVFLVGALLLSYVGLRRGPVHPRPYVYAEPPATSIVDTLAETHVLRPSADKSKQISVEVVASASSGDDAAICELTERGIAHDSDTGQDDEAADVWSEDTELDAIDEETTDVVPSHTAEAAPETTSQEGERPSWIYEDLQVDAEPHRITVQVGPHQSWKEIDLATDEALVRGLKQYAQWYLTADGRNLSTEIRADELQISLPRLRDCVGETFDYVHQSPSATMSEMPMRYVLLEFDKDFRKRVLVPSLNRSQSIARSKRAGMLAGGVLALLATALGLLKIDAATGGKRRRALTTAGIVAGAAGALTLIGVIR